MEQDEMPIQFGIAMTPDMTPIVVMILPDVVNPDTGEDGYVIPLGDAAAAEQFSSYLLRVSALTVDMENDLGEDPDEEDVLEIVAKYAQILSAPYN
jgi:hypothetical protein